MTSDVLYGIDHLVLLILHPSLFSSVKPPALTSVSSAVSNLGNQSGSEDNLLID